MENISDFVGGKKYDHTLEGVIRNGSCYYNHHRMMREGRRKGDQRHTLIVWASELRTSCCSCWCGDVRGQVRVR